MKTSLLLAALLAVPGFAHASYFQDNCTNAGRTTSITSGHSANYIEVSVYDPKTGKTKPVRDEEGALRSEDSQEVTLHTESRKACHGNTGSSLYRNVTAKKVRITRADGGLFDRNTSGVTEDRKAVEDFVICERVVTNIMPCK